MGTGNVGTVAIVSESVVRKLITRRMAYEAIRTAFESVANHQAEVFKVAFARGFNANESYGVKMGADAASNNLGLKIGSYWPGNAEQGLPAHGSTIVMIDPATGFPEAIVGAAYLNGFRTAAADAIAVDYLARKNASVLGVIGAGHQAEHEIRAISKVRELESIKIFTRSEKRARWMTGRLKDLDTAINFTTAEQAVRGSDIICTVTPSKEAIVLADWVEDGSHISAMGSDGRGKKELDTAIMAGARLYADLPEQSVEIGEFQHAFAEGIISSPGEICPIGLVTQDLAAGRTNESEITVFDSSGIAIQDLSIARLVLDAATEQGVVNRVEI